MTVAIGIEHAGRVFLAADRAAVWETGRVDVPRTKKVHRAGPYVLAFAGSFRGWDDCRRVTLPAPPMRVTSRWVRTVLADSLAKVKGIELLVGTLGGNGLARLSCRGSDGAWSSHAGYVVGSGADAAKGLLGGLAWLRLDLPPERVLRAALRASYAVHGEIRPPFDFVATPPSTVRG